MDDKEITYITGDGFENPKGSFTESENIWEPYFKAFDNFSEAAKKMKDAFDKFGQQLDLTVLQNKRDNLFKNQKLGIKVIIENCKYCYNSRMWDEIVNDATYVSNFDWDIETYYFKNE